MTDTQKTPWKRLSVEAVAIVTSILFAFSIDAWWDDRQRVNDEHVFLQFLLEDLREKKSLLASDRKYNNAILQATIGLLHAANDPNLELSEDSLDQMIERTWWYNTEGSWDSAPMRSLVSGDLSIVSNPSLLQKLAKLQISISGIRNFYEIDDNFHHNTYTPFLIANANMPQLTNQTEHHPGRPEVSYVYPKFELLVKQDHTQLLRQQEFQNMLIAKMDRIQDILQNAYRFIDEELDEVIVLLDEELAD